MPKMIARCNHHKVCNLWKSWKIGATLAGDNKPNKKL